MKGRLAIAASAALCVLSDCAPSDPSAEIDRQLPPPARLEFDWGAAWELAAPESGVAGVAGASGSRPVGGGVRDALDAIAFCAGASHDEVSAALEGSAAGSFRFAEARSPEGRREARETLEALGEAAAIHRAAIERRVAMLLPTDAPAATLVVRVVVGMPAGFVHGTFDDGGHRGVLLDAAGLRAELGAGESLRDRAGEQLDRILAPELLVAAIEAVERSRGDGRPDDLVARLRRALLVEGVADHLAQPSESRFDERRRRPPQIDVFARDAFAKFETNLSRIAAASTSAEERDALAFTFANGPRDERWGVVVGSFMADTIERFGRAGRMREVVALGPLEFLDAYAEVCSAHASVPRLSTKAIAILSR